MLLHLSVILFTGGGQRCTAPGRPSPPPPNGHCSGWYASYWNAFLSQFHAVLWKIWQNHMFAIRGLLPPATGNPGSAPDDCEQIEVKVLIGKNGPERVTLAEDKYAYSD